MIKKWMGIFLLLSIVTLSACIPAKEMGMTAIMPVGKAFAEGKEIFFMHTETSDPEIANLLTKMMDSPVLLVPSLADAPQSSLADVYVFTNGIKGMGPLGYAPDVFNSPPGTDGYSPLRKLNLVTWVDGKDARELRSAAEVLGAEDAGEVTIAQPGIVINMPFVVWEEGKR